MTEQRRKFSMTAKTKVRAFIDRGSLKGDTYRVLDQERGRINVGIIWDGGGPDDAVLDLEMSAEGRWSLVKRRYAERLGTTLAEGQMT